MKLTTSITTLLALLTIPLLGQADEDKTTPKTENKISIKSITLKEGESIGEAIQKAIEETKKENEKKVKAPKKHTLKPEIKITTQEIEITQDGKKQIIQLGGAGIPENDNDTINKAINKALKVAGKSNQTILIGPDGKKIPLNEGDTLADAINKLTKTVSPDQPGITRIGPAFVTGSADTTELKKEISELKNELAEQRKLLEAILEKLK